MNYLLDTNVFHNIGLKEYLQSKKDCGIIISIITLEELEKQKTQEGIKGYRARNAIREIYEIKKFGDLCSWIKLDNNVSIKVEKEFDDKLSLRYDKMDDLIIGCLSSCNSKYGKTILVTDDIAMSLKTESLGMKTEQTDEDDKYTFNDYKGIKIIDVNKISHDVLAKHYETPTLNVFNLHENEYLILKQNGKRKDDIKRWSNGSFHRLKYKEFAVEPKDDLQACALDLLTNRDIPIKIITGNFGSGKTFLSCQQIFKDFKCGKYSKLVMARQADGDSDSLSVGFLKGSYSEKIEPFFKPIIDNLGFDGYALESMKARGEIEFEIPFYLKGRSFNGDVAIYVDEAEDLTVKTIKLIGSRIGQNERGESGTVIFAGDYKQTEKNYIKDNGLLYLIAKTKNNPLVGYVNLEVDYRSEASKVFAEL